MRLDCGTAYLCACRGGQADVNRLYTGNGTEGICVCYTRGIRYVELRVFGMFPKLVTDR